MRELGEPDVLILPGTKSTIRDLDWLRSTGLEAKILQKQARGTLILGICGGFQMLGTEVVDVEGVEGPVGARTRGLGLLPLRTEFEAEKTRTQTRLVLEGLTGEFAALNGQRVDGYEIHMGRTIPDHHTTDAVPRGNAPDDSTRWRDEAMVPAGPASGAVTTSH